MIQSIYTSISFFILAALFTACGNESSSADTRAASTEQKIQLVQVVNPIKKTFTEGPLITGSAEPNQQVMLYAMESGYVQTMHKDIGDAVRKGDVIATLENPQLSGEFQEKNAMLASKKSIYDRLKSTYETTPSITPIQLVEQAEGEYLALKAAVDAAQNRLNKLDVRAPFSGIITERYLDKGALVQSGLSQSNPQAIVQIQETNPVRIKIPLPAADMAGAHLGMDVSVAFPVLSDETIKAKITRTSGVLDASSKTMQIEIDISNKDGKIKPGMYAKVQFLDVFKEDVLSLPTKAKSIEKDGAFLYAVKDNKVMRIPLEIGLSSKDYFEVLNTDIDENTAFIIEGKGLVKDGQTVAPKFK